MLRADAPVFTPLRNAEDAPGAEWKGDWHNLQRAVKSLPSLHAVDMHVYGSAESGLGLGSADVDATVIAPGRLPAEVLQLLAEELPSHGFFLREEVYGARVPILRLRGGGTDFDISVNNILPM